MLTISLSTGGETNASVGGVKDGVVVLEELLANDGVDTGSTTVVDPGVVLAGGEAEVAVLGSGDEVLGGGEGVGGGAELDAKVAGGLGGEDSEASAGVSLTSGRGQELFVGSSGDVDESGTSVDDTGGRGGKGGGSVGEGSN